jgi:transketolase
MRLKHTMMNPVATTFDGTSRPTSELKRIAAQARVDALQMIYAAQSGHPGTSFSCLDILTSLYFSRMSHSSVNDKAPERDRFVMSKGHGAPALYAVLMASGYIDRAEIPTLRQVNSKLQGHPASRYVKGVDVSTGSLGQGLSCGVGMALGHRIDGLKSRVWVLMGDGELQEGNCWEAVMSAAHHKVSRLTAIVDRNRLQIDGSTEDVKALGEVAPKFAAFGWNVLEVDGHDYEALAKAFDQADAWAEESSKPTCIVANTVKGKGVSFMENVAGWHGKAPNKDQMDAAMLELETTLAQCH